MNFSLISFFDQDLKTDIGKVRTRIIGSTKPILSSHSKVLCLHQRFFKILFIKMACLNSNIILIAFSTWEIFNLFIFHNSEFISTKITTSTRMIHLLIAFLSAGFCHPFGMSPTGMSPTGMSPNDVLAPFLQADPPYECP